VAVDQFVVLLADAAVYYGADAFGEEGSFAAAFEDRAVAEPPDEKDDCETDEEAHEGEEDPVLCHPENQSHVISVPAAAAVMREEAPWMVVVLVWEEYAYAVFALGASAVVVAPDYTQKQRPGGSHNGDVGEQPVAIIVWKRVDCL